MKFKKQVIMEVLVGVFSFAMIFVLLAMTTVLSEELLFRRYETVEIVFDSVTGLVVGNEVNVRGVTVGKVKRIFLKEDGVHVVARLDTPIRLWEDYAIEVKAGSILGGSYVFIAEGRPPAPEVPLDQLLRGTATMDLMNTATRTVQDIQDALNDGILEDLKASLAQIRKITTSLGEGEGVLGSLLGDPLVKADIQQIAANLRAISDAITQGTGTIGKLVMDDEVYQQVRAIGDNLSGISTRLAKGEGTLGRLLNEDDQVYQDLAATIAQIRGVSESIGRGEGSLGRLLSDEALFLEFQSLLREARAAIDDVRETSPITTFTSIFFGAF